MHKSSSPAIVRTAALCALALIALGALAACDDRASSAPLQIDGIWISRAELTALPMSGQAWAQLLQVAREPAGRPDLADQKRDTNVRILAKALVQARTGDRTLRYEVIDGVMSAIGTEKGGRTLSLGRKLITYVIAADLVKLPPDEDQRFRAWLRDVLNRKLKGRTLRSTHESRPNNWGTHAGASRVAVAAYLGDRREIERAARVFRGWLGDRESYADFEWGSLSWQADRERPVGINPVGATRDGHSIDGVLPDDQRRAGIFTWPPPKENYVYGALQGALAQAVILSRAGFDVWEWEERALLRALRWLNEEANFPPEGDDVWLLPLYDHFYATNSWNGAPTLPGKNVGWTGWTHGNRTHPSDKTHP
jgi:hypothetical protein